MASRYYQELPSPGYSDLGFPGHNVDHLLFGRRSNSPTYWATPLDPTVVRFVQCTTAWDAGDGLRQPPAISPMISSASPASLRGSEGGYSLIGAQPVGICLDQPQVSPAAVSEVAG